MSSREKRTSRDGIDMVRIANIAAVIILFILFLLFLLVDLMYSKKIQYNWLIDIIYWPAKILSAIGFKYQAAKEILEKNLGILITMVSLILTMTVNVSERAEKKVYGISREELSFSRYKIFYKSIRKITYAAPVFMFVFINLGYCLCGYLLLMCCYGFLVSHHVIYYRSYNQERDQEAVLRILIEYNSERLTEENEELLKYLSRLESMGNSIKKENNWEGAQQLYYALIEKVSNMEEKQAARLCYYFYDEIFEKRNHYIAIRVMRHCIREMDLITVQGIIGGSIESKQEILWGMLAITVRRSSEEDLAGLLNWFFNGSVRGKKTVESCNKTLPDEVFYKQTGAMLVLLEIRLVERKMQHGVWLEHKVKSVWKYCKRIYEEKFWKKLLFLSRWLPENEISKIRAAMNNFEDDIRFGSTKSAVMTMLQSAGGQDEAEERYLQSNNIY